ncbi:DUF2339 domain-containing protein [Pseudomonas synxantha]|uniref:DUF2339 domain-containing protein n=1 Tax=Pseudomonas synxantha TaxID=47883 RepID=A0ABS0UT24_9PSED|nr:DUF2339 domain-containing protein [Pseudomonas synxantha]MBI6567700.1 DUF2339 domain-containing protein [Pseudomonas synxantha]MBI6583134.1 DUF2339 domain-containing protein [Pseudomonas synxantha]MBI6642942.1 DUF2339 domain-containing protein [Pseudomonas synxantha]
MQWIFMLIGLVLGWALDESFSDAGIGALFGLGIGQALRLSQLSAQAQQQASQLETTQKALIALGERLRQLEVPTPTSNVAADPPVPEPAPVAKPSELVWELPAELTPGAMIAEPSRPLPDDAWTPNATPRPPEPLRSPNLIERAITAARTWLFGGNTVLRVGLVLLFLGLAFLLRYATEGMVVPIQLRYAGVATAAIGLLGLGWWLRRRNSNYGLMLQGAGIAVLYLTVFAAMRLHPLIDPGTAFGLLVVVTVFSAILALTQDALGLACAAALGGFAAPLLASTGAGSHVTLFSYFALLNAGILAIAWFKAWRPLNLIGFVGTFGIGFAWGMRSYTPDMLWSTEPFLIVFFLMYLAVGLLFARRKLQELGDAPEGDSRGALLRWSAAKGDYVDGSLLFGPPLVGFGLQFALVQHLEFAAAFSALALGILYMALARWLSGGRALLLAQTCLALGVIFASLAIPLGLDARWTTAAWAVEGAGIFWLGLRQQRLLARAFALLLQLGSALAFFSELRPGTDTLLEGPALSALLLGAALLFTFYQVHKAAPELAHAWERKGAPWLAALGLGCGYLLAPLLWSTQGSVIGWSLAGLVTAWAGQRLGSQAWVRCAVAVQLLSGISFALDPVSNFYTPMIIALAAMTSAWCLRQQQSTRSSKLLLGWGVVWWGLAVLGEVWRSAPTDWHATWLYAAAALSTGLWCWLALRLRWVALGAVCTLLMPVAGMVLLGTWDEYYHPAANLAGLAWVAVFALHFVSLRRLALLVPQQALSVAHVLGCWMLIGVLTLELRYGLMQLSSEYNAWRWLGWAILPSLYLVLAAPPRAWPWPVSAYPREYRVLATLPLAVLMLGWFWLANMFSDGSAKPMPYVPLISPLDLGLLFALLGVYLWSRSVALQRGAQVTLIAQAVVGASLFAFFTALVMRTAHHWSGVPFHLDALLESMRVQAGLSIVWTLIALGLMIGGHLRHRREVWLVGAVLIAVVVAKLFFVELSNRGGLARIVSFIGVGGLLLVVGYFAPLPPKRAEPAGRP